MSVRPLRRLSLAVAPRRVRQGPRGEAVLRHLAARGTLPAAVLPQALALLARREARLADILISRGWVAPADLLAAEAALRLAQIVDPDADPPDPRLIDRWGAARCIAEGLLPWRRAGGVVVVATARPEHFARREGELIALYGPVVMALADEAAIGRAVLVLRAAALAHRAETLVPDRESCRRWRAPDPARAAPLVLVALAVLLAAPRLVFGVLMLWTLITLAATTALKAAALWAQLRARRLPARPGRPPVIARLPCVSILVPLFHEPDIAARLIARIARLDYPRELLDILLCVEAEDATTAAALAATALPPFMRVVTVPPGPLKTKPRALNFALPFCRGNIIGVYDAEDAPDPDQITRVVHRFHERGAEVACLQGRLDFYNPRTNWLTRCFTIEYAAWFRVMLPGLVRLGLPIPLGGTTLFFRRAALEALEGWDAHNVTEDADLGLRLARHGYRAELVETDTAEEATSHPRAWVKQRSRWLKGYVVTWAVHMRQPRRLWRELGPRRFWAVQVLFLGTITQFLLAPLLWSCWLLMFGLPHPMAGLPAPLLRALTLLFLASEAVNIATGLIGLAATRHRGLMPWVPTLSLYFPLGAIAAAKGVWELIGRPFYWDKTAHGHHVAADDPPSAGPDPPVAALSGF
ncbi:MAG: glycosyltransferase [Rhodobacteraceae bacterium]|nr:glycosyltransferase [Paracoccaceae bacterium]